MTPAYRSAGKAAGRGPLSGLFSSLFQAFRRMLAVSGRQGLPSSVRPAGRVLKISRIFRKKMIDLTADP